MISLFFLNNLDGKTLSVKSQDFLYQECPGFWIGVWTPDLDKKNRRIFQAGCKNRN